jgi:hypothetical protein
MCTVMVTKSKVNTGVGFPKMFGPMLRQYTSGLTKDLNPRGRHDVHVAKILLEYAKDKSYINDILNTKERMGMSSRIFKAVPFKEKLDRFVMPNHPNFNWNVHYAWAKCQFRQELKRIGLLHPVLFNTEQDIIDSVDRLNTSAGYLRFYDGKYKKLDNLSLALEMLKLKSKDFANSDYSPIIFGTRTKLKDILDEKGNLNTKWSCSSRVIHVVSEEDIFLEFMTGKPLMRALCNLDWYAGGMDDRELTKRINHLRINYGHWLSVDYSAYDTTVSDWLIRDAFNLLFELFDDKELPKGYKEFIIKGFTYTQYLDTDGKIKRKNKGIPSGSYFTQAIGSVINKLMVMTYMHSAGIDDFEMMIMGDDNLIFTKDYLKSASIMSYLKKNFGIIGNVDKEGQGESSIDHPTFLSRTWKYEGPWRDIKEIVVGLTTADHFRRHATTEMSEQEIIDGNYCKAHEIFFGQYYSYPGIFSNLFDMERFFMDYPYLKACGWFTFSMLSSASGSMKYKLLYTESGRSLLRLGLNTRYAAYA